jgi:ribosomal protein S6--L-glutamate ligase
MFELLKIPHPRTRVYFGKRQKKSITDHFPFPFVAKVPRGSAMGRGVFLIRQDDDLQNYLKLTTTAYIQEYLPSDRDIRAVVIGDKIVHAYWRVAPEDDFRCNVAVGGRVSLDRVPPQALDLALYTARSCRWDDVGIDICQHDGDFYVLEANMKYGKEGFQQAGINYTALMEAMIDNEEI